MTTTPDDPTTASADRFRVLPEPVRFEDMTTAQTASPVPDPTMGRDSETEFLWRNAGLG